MYPFRYPSHNIFTLTVSTCCDCSSLLLGRCLRVVAIFHIESDFVATIFYLEHVSITSVFTNVLACYLESTFVLCPSVTLTCFCFGRLSLITLLCFGLSLRKVFLFWLSLVYKSFFVVAVSFNVFVCLVEWRNLLSFSYHIHTCVFYLFSFYQSPKKGCGIKQRAWNLESGRHNGKHSFFCQRERNGPSINTRAARSVMTINLFSLVIIK